jgi:uncharacterized membrane protein YwzB
VDTGGIVGERFHEGLEKLYQSNDSDLYDFLDDFAASGDVPAAIGDFKQWLDSRSPTVPAGAPTFMDIADGDEALAFRAAVEYISAFGISFMNFEDYAADPYVFLEPVKRDGYRGPYGDEFLLLWETLDAWTRANEDACNTFFQYWNWHIATPPPRAPVIINVITYEIPNLLLPHNYPGQAGVGRIVLHTVFLAMWGIFTGIAVSIFLNNSRLFQAFLIPRAIVSLVLALAVAYLLSSSETNIGMPARGLLAVYTCLLYLPTYRWDANVYK